jgi:hypothetical protein
MKDSEIIFVVEESPEGGYEAHALGYAIFTQADTMDELGEMVADAARCYFDEGTEFSINLLPVSPRKH